MKILIVAATEGEVIQTLPANATLLITGVGMVAMAYTLTKALQQQQYDLVLQVGIAGSFDRGIALGEVVFITSEQYGDLGAQDHENYLDIFEMGLLQKDVFPFSGAKLQTPIMSLHDNIKLRKVSGLTVNTVSGNQPTIDRLTQTYGGQTESMEGAAFHYVCLREKVAFAQVRAISNYVEPRNKGNWKMKEAIIALNKWLIDFLGAL